MKNLYVRWNKVGWPLTVGLEPLPAILERNAAQHAANQEWEAEGGALKPTMVAGPKLPL